LGVQAMAAERGLHSQPRPKCGLGTPSSAHTHALAMATPRTAACASAAALADVRQSVGAERWRSIACALALVLRCLCRASSLHLWRPKLFARRALQLFAGGEDGPASSRYSEELWTRDGGPLRRIAAMSQLPIVEDR